MFSLGILLALEQLAQQCQLLLLLLLYDALRHERVVLASLLRRVHVINRIIRLCSVFAEEAEAGTAAK